jgi:ABC-type branched-subunit amino acid transport system ATPase component
MTLLDISDLEGGYGSLQVLSGVDLTLGKEEYVAVVGPNGAGKSTVMKCIVGLADVMAGEVTFQGADVSDLSPEQCLQKGISYIPQTGNVFENLTVEENLRIGAYTADGFPRDRVRSVFDRFPALEENQNRKAGLLSGGQQQMLAMGRGLMLDPDLLLLDEPSAGLAPDLVGEMFDRIDQINDDGTAVLMVEQNAREALRRCDRGYVLAGGENRFEDTGDALLEDESVRRQFLGA